jgi:hypothetical protein
MKYKEIASKLNISPKTVERQVGIALEKTEANLKTCYVVTSIFQILNKDKKQNPHVQQIVHVGLYKFLFDAHFLFQKLPGKTFLHFAHKPSGVPLKSILPPPEPPSGPRSIT